MMKLIHMSTAFISITLFCLRVFWVLGKSDIMKQKWVKIVPHVNDTVLLATAIFLTFGIRQFPFTHDWLTAKFAALMLYIIFGMFALKWAKTRNTKILFFILAIITFSYIVMVAMTRSVSLFH